MRTLVRDGASGTGGIAMETMQFPLTGTRNASFTMPPAVKRDVQRNTRLAAALRDAVDSRSSRAPINAAESRWMSYVYLRLESLLLNPDPEFNPYPTQEDIQAAWRVVQDVLRPETPTPSVVPSEDGGIQFVWHKAGWDIELDVDAWDASVWVRSRRTGEMWLLPLDEARQRFSEIMSELAAS